MHATSRDAEALARSHRANLVAHSGTCGETTRLPAGAIAVRNAFLTTPTFNFVTDLEGAGSASGISSLLSGLGSELFLLWRGPAATMEALGAAHLLTYRVLHRPPEHGPAPGRLKSRVLPDPGDRSAAVIDLAVDACGVEIARPLFEHWALDPRYIWIVNQGGVCLLRPGYDIVCAYEEGVVENQRGKGFGRDLKMCVNEVAADLGLPLVTHVRPGGLMERLAFGTGDRAAFEDRFHRLVLPREK